jgi:periplasmic divalent cation tolerance protein
MVKKYIIVQTHTNKKQIYENISKSLVEKKMAACVNIYPAVLSIYRYNSEVVEDNEYLIHVKTIADKFNEIRKIIERLHNYETPEIISLEILEGNEKYLKWIHDEID